MRTTWKPLEDPLLPLVIAAGAASGPSQPISELSGGRAVRNLNLSKELKLCPPCSS